MTYVVTFSTVHYVMKSEKVFRQRGLPVRLIPTPRHISSDCGMAVEISDTDEDAAAVRALLRGAGLPEPDGIYPL
jgi:hypothetical protein